MDIDRESTIYIDLFQEDLDTIAALRAKHKVDDLNIFCQLRINQTDQYVSGNPESATHKVELVIFGEGVEDDIHEPLEG